MDGKIFVNLLYSKFLTPTVYLIKYKSLNLLFNKKLKLNFGVFFLLE